MILFFLEGGGLKPWKNKAEEFADNIRHLNSLRYSPAIFLKVARPKLEMRPKSGSPKPHPSKPHPCNMPQAVTSENGSCAAVFGMLRCRNCTATFAFLQCGRHLYQKLRSSKRKTALQHRNRCVAAFLPLSCGFQAPTFRHPRFRPADQNRSAEPRDQEMGCGSAPRIGRLEPTEPPLSTREADGNTSPTGVPRNP